MAFEEVCETYYHICSVLPKLCPRLVPEPLWGVSIANIVKLSPSVADALCQGCGDAVRDLVVWWRGLDRSVCSVCNASGTHIDEDWRYFLAGRGGIACGGGIDTIGSGEVGGIAVLAALRSVCRRCHDAKHIGRSIEVGMGEEAMKWLSYVNNLDLIEIEWAVDKAHRVWEYLSMVNRWRIIVGDIGLREDLRGKLEELLNTMIREGLSIYRGWLIYIGRCRACIERAAIETERLLNEVRDPGGRVDLDKLVSIVNKMLGGRGVKVMVKELKHVIERAGATPQGFMSAGKWIVFLNPSNYAKLFVEAIHELRARELNYEAKTLPAPEKPRDQVPLIFYTPSFLAVDQVFEVLEAIRSVLKRYNLSLNIYYKPDIFTVSDIYFEHKRLKPYIYLANTV